MPPNKRVLLGVTGSIAAYKAALIVRELQKQKARLQVVMTSAATEFITPLTLQTLSGRPVFAETFPQNSRQALAHIELAQEVDLVLIAPATANIIAKLAAGIADNLLSALCLATPAPVLIAPAMNSNMYTNPSTQANIKLLKERNIQFVEPESGELACGDEGPGRLADIAVIAARVQQILTASQTLSDKKIVITAGPTRERIDALRFISNRSSGKMGYALAEEAQQRGAEVVLISGPVGLNSPRGVTVRVVESALEMKNAVEEELAAAQVLIMSAAVADFTPAEPVAGKIKKFGGELRLTLSPAPDILAEIGRRADKPLLIGFAAESENMLESARRKLTAKNLDMIVANDISKAGADNNQICVIDKAGNPAHYPLMSKTECSKVILDKTEELLRGKNLFPPAK